MDAQHRVLLTGTPLQNSLEELFYLMNFLEPDKFPNVEEFKAAYATLNDKDKVSLVCATSMPCAWHAYARKYLLDHGRRTVAVAQAEPGACRSRSTTRIGGHPGQACTRNHLVVHGRAMAEQFSCSTACLRHDRAAKGAMP